jgi:hypothetical protein
MTATKWQEMSTNSHYLTAVAVRDALDEGDVSNARAGLEELIDALSRSERRALRSHLIQLMLHVIKWVSQPERRSNSWIATIYNARDEIAAIQEETPSLNRQSIEALWESCFKQASRLAKGQMKRKPTLDNLSWTQVFELDYELPDDTEERSEVEE